ncbi:hypothetical protein ACH5RR_014531 [Cinchona calisaya]|uniref:4-coumarate--CoA ligase n=1 Tax=Cinchona calisaya TaxID=153742 RepID=A0ABD3A4J6_9GENT
MEIKSNPSSKIDPKTGYCPETQTFHSLRPILDLPAETIPLSAASYALSLQSTLGFPANNTPALINSATGHRVSYPEFTFRVKALATSLQTSIGLSRNDAAFVLASTSTHIPVLYFALLSLRIVISPANPLSNQSEISRQINLSKPTVAFATSATSHKLPDLKHGTILIDTPEFESMMTNPSRELGPTVEANVNQSDVAAILYSSGTTGQVKGVMLTHRNLIAVVAGYYTQGPQRSSPAVILYTVPYFHVFGFFYSLKSVALNETVVLLPGRFDLRNMLKAVEEFRVTHIAAAPPVVVAMAKGDVRNNEYDLSCLEAVGSGGAPLGEKVIKAFKHKFPRVILSQGYGLTETTGAAFRVVGAEESLRLGSVGRLVGNCEAKIVDPETGVALPPGKQGELWMKGPITMKGYVDNPKATSEAFDLDGWVKTGDLCYFDSDGFLFVVDRLKELIKYKGYQVPPAELEHLLQCHPDIAEAAVIPYPDEEAGQVPMAFVVKQPQSSLDEAQVIEYIAKQVAPYKKIRRVSFVSFIPKSAAGKILRKELRKIALPESKL